LDLPRPSGTRKIFSPKWALFLLFLADGAGFGIWAAHVAVFKHDLALSDGALTFVLFSAIVGAIVMMPIAGRLLTRHSSRSVIRAAAPCFLAALLLLGQTQSFAALVVAAALFGAAKGALDVSINAHVFAVEAFYQKPMQGLFQGSWSTGGLIAAVASTQMLHWGGTRRIDLSTTACLLFVVVVLAMPALIVERMQKSAPRAKKGFHLPEPFLLQLALITACGMLCEGSIADWASVYLHAQVHVSLAQAAGGYAAFCISMASMRYASDWLVRLLNPRQVLQGGGVLIAAGIGCATAFPYWIPALVGFMLAGMGIAVLVPVTFGLVGRSAKQNTGQAISTMSTIAWGGFLSGPPIIGSLTVFVGLRGALLVVVVAGLTIAAGASYVLRGSRVVAG
jgi:MFS family permease